MGFLKKYSAKFFLKQWNIGLSFGDIKEIIRRKKNTLTFRWLPLPGWKKSYADPFIFKDRGGRINILYEDFSTDKLDGKIDLMICDEHLNCISSQTILKTDDHLSYPFVFQKKDKVYVFPENAYSGAVYCYELNQADKTLDDRRKIIDFPLIDPTIIEHNGKYWLFGTKLGASQEQDRLLFIYYADDLFGPYQPHASNPVKDNINGSRPAGSFIEVDGNIFRPVQNSKNYYGEYLSINKIIILNENEFAEEEYMKWYPDPKSKYNKGLHTINVAGNIIIVDGLTFYFQPFKQFMRWFKKN
jgi:hypothetical protein